MQHRSVILTVVLAIALAIPAASATWRVHGSFEPDTKQDREGGFMWNESDIDPLSPGQVYFNAFLGNGYFSAYNPNVGAAESRIIADGFQFPYAFLGVWKDCNDDGYIGLAEDVVSEYPSALANKTICPTGSEWNKNGWVFEFLWIGPGDIVDEGNQVNRFVNDTQSYIWGDVGLADPDAGPAGGGCYINPQHGFFKSTGGALMFADCFAGRPVTNGVNCATVGNPDWAIFGHKPPCPEADKTNTLGLAFEDVNYPACSSSKLNQEIGLFHDDPRCADEDANLLEQGGSQARQDAGYGEEPAFTVWDCNGGVNAKVHDAKDSYWDAANHTIRYAQNGDCDTSKQTALSGRYTAPEYEVAADLDIKRESDFPFRFHHYFVDKGNCGFYGSPSSRVEPDAITQDWCAQGVPATADKEAPPFGGVGYLRGAFVGIPGPVWISTVGSTGYAPTVDVDIENTRYDIENPRYYTFYAHVSSEVTSKGYVLPGSSGVYGSEYCGTNIGPGQPVVTPSNFDCDPTHWWNDEFGASKPKFQGPREYTVDVGQPYNLKDIDCYDGSVASGLAPGYGYGLTTLSPQGPCTTGV